MSEAPTPSAENSVPNVPSRRTILKIFGGVSAVFAIVIAVLLIVIAMQPDDFQISRSGTINASPATVFAHVNDFHRWEHWSPWAKLDPAAKNSFEGPASGAGAVFRWSGNSEVGEGSMTVTESTPPDRIRIRLDFIRPFEDTSDVEFTFAPEGDQTRVTWLMSGKNNFISKAFCLFMNMDQMVGGQFEQGLAAMKTAVEQTK